jgi:hypothetical protein
MMLWLERCEHNLGHVTGDIGSMNSARCVRKRCTFQRRRPHCIALARYEEHAVCFALDLPLEELPVSATWYAHLLEVFGLPGVSGRFVAVRNPKQVRQSQGY